MENYFNQNNINLNIRDRVRKYLEFSWKLEQRNNLQEQMILDKLPKVLKEEILLESIGKKLHSFHLLSKNFSEEFLARLSIMIKPIRFSPEEIIYQVKMQRNFFNLKLAWRV